MQKVVNISNNKKNVLEFDIEVTGADDDNMSVRFIIESEGMELGFDSKKGNGDTWSVEIPPMKILQKSKYPFHISVIVDGYAFEGLKGEVNVVGERTIKVSEPENIILSPAKPKTKPVVKKEPKEKATIVKPKHKALIKPTKLKMVDGETLKKNMAKKNPVVDVKKEDKLSDNVVDLISKAGAEKKASEAKKVEPKKVVKKKIKKAEPKKVKEDIFQQAPKANSGGPIYPIIKDGAKKVLVEEVKKPEKEINDGFSAKNIAQSLIKAVTGIGEKHKETIAEQHDKAVKDILKEGEPVHNKKDVPAKKRASGKKVIRGKEIVEVDTTKEDKIKDILEEDTRTITTKPDKTIH